MKYAAILLTMFLTSALAKADPVCTESAAGTQTMETRDITTDVPNYLKGAVVIVRLADGKESRVPAEKFKVVPRLQQYLITKVKETTTKSCSSTIIEHRNNRVSALVGYGATGHLDRSGGSEAATVESSRGVLGGAMYQRLLGEHLSLGAQVQSDNLKGKNDTGLGVLGWEF